MYGDQQGGKYVDQHQYTDFKKPGRVNKIGRMHNAYDQSRQLPVIRNKGKFSPWWYALAGVVFVVVSLFVGMIYPRLQNTIPFNFLFFFVTKPGLNRFLKSLFWGLIGGGVVIMLAFIDNDENTLVQQNAPKMLDDPDYASQSFLDNPEEEPETYNIAPDTKSHFKGDVTSILSHMMIKQVVGLKGKDGTIHFDNKFGNKIFDMAKLPKDGDLRKFYDPGQLLYNPSDSLFDGKLHGKTVKDVINNYWHTPDYELNSQDPAGIYIVSTKPENTVVAAETRAGKGQHYIEEMLDIWSREDHKPNIVVTDLKMELLKQFLRSFTMRGYNVKALNLLVDSKTDAINFVGYAVNAAIRGDATQMQTLITNLAGIYFPNKGNDNPMWPQAAGAVFSMVVMTLIDYYYEEIQDMKNDPRLSLTQIAQKSDEAWGHVTLYNAYCLIVDMASKMYPKDTYVDMYDKDPKTGEALDPDPDATSKSALTLYFEATRLLPKNAIREKIQEQAGAIKITGKSERTMASIYAVCLFGMIFFTNSEIINLTSARPSQNLDMKGFAFPRRLGVHFNREFLKKHGYTNAITEWTCYHDPAMKHPYEGSDFIYQGSIDKFGWTDAVFRGIFDTHKIVKKKIEVPRGSGHYRVRIQKQLAHTYLRLKIIDSASFADKDSQNLILATYDFDFVKDFRKTINGENYAKNTITKHREVLNGSMREYNYVASTNQVKYFSQTFTKEEHSLLLSDSDNKTIQRKYRIIDGFDIHYSDNPTALFLVAPPNKPAYNKLLLNTLDMLYNEQVSASLILARDQKPFNVTKYLCDEFGNMQSEGSGVPALDTKLTSGLAQGQQFTMILQSMKQLETIYGENVSQILQANVGTFFFLKSKDSALIKMLMDMNGKKYVVQNNNQTYDTPLGGFHLYDEFKNAKKAGTGDNRIHVQESWAKEERPLLSENDYLHLNQDVTDGNAIVSRGSNTILSKGPTILPMSAALYTKNHTGGYGKDIVQTALPMMSDASNFNALTNIPDFEHMLAQRIEEAKMTKKVVARFKKVTGMSEHDMEAIDSNTLSERLMYGIHQNMRGEDAKDAAVNGSLTDLSKSFDEKSMEKGNDSYQNMSDDRQTELDDQTTNTMNDVAAPFIADYDNLYAMHKQDTKKRRNQIHQNKSSVDLLAEKMAKEATKNTDFMQERAKKGKEKADRETKRYAQKMMSKADIMTIGHKVNPENVEVLRNAVNDDLNAFYAPPFTKKSLDNGKKQINDENGIELFTFDPRENGFNRINLDDHFVVYLCKHDNWDFIRGFDKAVALCYKQKLNDQENAD